MRTPTSMEYLAAQHDPIIALLTLPWFEVSRELRRNMVPAFQPAWWYAEAYYDFNCYVYLYALAPIAPFVRAWLTWRHCALRFSIERALKRRIIDKPEGEAWTNWSWKVRPLRKWSWRRTKLA